MYIEKGSVPGMEDFFLYEVENFLSPSYFSALADRVLKAPKYTYIPKTSGLNAACDEAMARNNTVVDNGQFVYSIIQQGDILDEQMFFFTEPMYFQIQDMFPQIKFHGMFRFKSNILTRTHGYAPGVYNRPHTDDLFPNTISAIFYLNDADGDTVMFKEAFAGANVYTDTYTEYLRMSPKANTLVVFNSGYFHASSNPVTADRRVVMNILFDAEFVGGGNGDAQ